MAHKEKLSGKEKFNNYYEQLYGSRWENLSKALLQKSEPVSLKEELPSFSEFIKTDYFMDRASILGASMLPVKATDSVLDMCAAPGGKTLILALKLEGKGKLVSNDRSANRRNRLINVIEDCLYDNYKTIITVTGHDSTKWGLYEKDSYDCVLLDAPCSSERHVINDETALSQWGPNRPKMLSSQQFAMAVAALDAVKIGGYILYSTCSINPMENENVIEKLFSRRPERFEEVSLDNKVLSLTDKLKHGYIVLPDTQDNKGPLYFCLLRRIS
ncbi:MAG: RsmB/NOP family class I SAM-dependent RNA methyltransferase [Sphaerochaetaceae bacterium]|nr:RsmB/NOP family class I SAM-dependent RNA methyltransferase [Sphaerochaetaceae bacterium]